MSEATQLRRCEQCRRFFRVPLVVMWRRRKWAPDVIIRASGPWACETCRAPLKLPLAPERRSA